MRGLIFHRSAQAIIRFVLISLCSFSLVVSGIFLTGVPPASSQLPSVSIDTARNALNPPNGVSRAGEYEIAEIRSPLDNKLLFEVTSPTIFNRDQVPEGQMPVEIRAQEVNERLWRVFYRTVSSRQTPTVAISTLNNRPIIQISDNQFSRPIRLVTITEPDADWHGKALNELAQEWQAILQAETSRFKQLTAPEVVLQRLGQALQIFLGLLLASGVIWWLRQRLNRRHYALETRYQEQLAALAASEEATTADSIAPSDGATGEETEAREIADLRSRFLATVQHQFTLKRQLDIDKFFKWALFWLFIGMWYLGIAHIMSTVPLLMRWSLYIWATPLALLIIWFGISLAIRISKSLIDRGMHSWEANPLLSFGETQRITLRSATIANALKGLVTFILIIVGLIWTLSLFNVPTSSILAGGAVIGLAISFGTQSLIKDLVNGCLILIEDQFAAGDVIEIDNKSGLVENLNLRVTQIRNSEGQLITIPNSSITSVCNLTRLWSRVDFSILVAYENDPKQVLDILQQVSQQMYSEPEWRDRLPELPEVLGIDDLSHTGMLVRVWIKTAPMEQWSVGREFRLRVRQAFAANNIQIGRPQWMTINTELG